MTLARRKESEIELFVLSSLITFSLLRLFAFDQTHLICTRAEINTRITLLDEGVYFENEKSN